MFGDITIKSRPLRLAFIIPPDQGVLRDVIQANSTVWGGLYNPIIPLYKRAPKSWRLYPTEQISIPKRALGYIRAFDPDFLVNCTGADLPPYVEDLKRATVVLDDIWKEPPTDNATRTPRYGVGLFELLAAIYDEYFAVVQRFPAKLILPTLPQKHTLFWQATVGDLAPAFKQPILDCYSKHLDIETPPLNATTYPQLLGGGRILPRDIVRYHIRVEGGTRLDRSLAFYMDADSFMDIVDYWNLRAIGRPVLAVPKQFAGLDAYKKLVRTYLKQQFRVSRFNPQMTYGTSLIRSFSTEMSEVEAFARSLNLASAFEKGVPLHVLSLQHWYPRIWDEWAIDKDGAAPDSLSCTSETVSFPNTDGSVSFSLVAPDFRTDSPMEGPRYANEIHPKFYGGREDLRADVLPYDHGDRVLRAAGGPVSMRDGLRIGRSGLVHLVDWKSHVSWDIPLAEDVFLAWLADKGFPSKLSSCGLLAKEIHTQLRGWLSVLTDEPVLKLLDDMSKGDEEGRGLRLDVVRNRLKQIDASGRVYNALIEHKAFQLGYKTQCSHCRRASWYSVSDLGSELTCPLCYKQVDSIKAVDADNKGHWSLRTAGGFSVKNHADGAYCVLLTLNFFERDMHYQTTPVFSFEPAAPGGLGLEADFATLWQESAFGETQDGVLFAECKSYNKFEKRDFDRMRALGNAFPGAILAFCTLRTALDPAEVRAISRIVRTGMKHWKTDRPLNPVLVLTGRELFSLHGPPYCWDGLAVPEWAKHPRSLLEICNATQALYLGLPPWYEVWQATSDARRRKKQQATATAAAARGIAARFTGEKGHPNRRLNDRRD